MSDDCWIHDDVSQCLDYQHHPPIGMLCGEVAQMFSGSIMHNSSDDALVVSGTVLQRLMQENLRYSNGVGPENQVMMSPGNPTSAETLLLETQPRQEPQGQEHQVDSNSMEKNTKGAQNPAESIQVTLAVPGIGALELPSYEEAKSQSQLYRSQNEEQNVTHTYMTVHNTANTLTDPGHTYTSFNNTNQTFISPNPQTSLLPNQHIPTSTSSCPPSLSSAPSLSPFACAEGCSWVQRGVTGMDEGLAGLEHGHVRSLSESIMQLSLERNGAKHPTEIFSNGEKQTTTSISQSSNSLDPRGPPPGYPFKADVQSAYLSSVSPGPLSLEQTPLSMESLGQISSLMPPVLPQTGSGTRLPPQGQIVPAEAFTMMSHAQHMMTFLSNENQTLRQELLIQTEKMGKLQRLEAEVQRLSDAYENLVRSSSKRETLDKTMKMKLEGEIRRLHDFNRDLRDCLETANRKLANQEMQEDGHVYLSERRESLKEIKRLETEAESLRSANEDQRRHIEILEQALNNAQSKVVRLEEELGRKCVYVERVERLQQALAQLQAACEKREQLEKRLRTRLERELETLRSQQRAGVGVCESSALALLDRLREREERILGLEADRMRWEQKYLEESAMRQFAMEAAATAAAQRDTTIMQHSRSGSYSDAGLWPHDGDDKTYNRRCQDIETRMKDLHAQLLEKIAMIKVLQHRSRRDSTPLRPARSVPSIAVATGMHSRQASQAENVLLGKENVDHLPLSLPSFSASLSSLVPSLSSALPPSFPSLSVSTLPPPSVMSSSVTLPLAPSSSTFFLSSSATLPLPSTHSHSLPPLPPTISSSLPSTPLLSLHSKSASRDSSTQTAKSPESVKITPPTGRGRTTRMDCPTTQMKSLESRVLHTAGQKMQPADSDLVEILI